MAIPLTILGTTYQYPESGENPNWAQGPTEWAVAVTNVINSFVGAGDILETSFAIANNVVTLTNINGLALDPGTVRASNVDYSVYRTSTSNPSGNAEEGTLFLIYDDSAASGAKWLLSQRKDGEAGIVFSITDAGQIQFTTTDIGSAGYSGIIKFRAKSLLR
jgi:hypothetical protein